jgi:hypothetical protein
MSLQKLASQVQSHGRNGDTMLVHMTPKEVGGLQALARAAGGSLTVNPKTGLPEANFLESILPTVLGIGLSFIPGVGPLAAGALVGGGTALATGNIEKGLLAGLGAAGGAGLGGSLTAAGAAAPGSSAMASLGDEALTSGLMGSAKDIAATAPMSAAPTGFAANASNAGLGIQQAFGAPGQFLANNATNLAMAATPMLASAFDQSSAPPPPQDEGNIRQFDYTQELNPNFGMPGQPYFNQYYTPGPVTPASQFTGFAEGGIADLKKPYTQPTRTVDPAVTEYNANLMQRAQAEYNQAPQLAAFRSALPNQGVYDPQAGAALQQLQAQRAEQAKQMQPNQFGFQYDPATNSVVKAQPTEDQFATLRKQMDDLRAQQQSLQGSSSGFNVNYFDGDGVFANGGIARLNNGGYTLGGYSDGGQLLKGPGDGVSDDIPATIEDRQPARLADGEFVVPARIVSELGNGSTDAGARKLYAMMDRVQKKRSKTTGKDRIAVDTKAAKELPA